MTIEIIQIPHDEEGIRDYVEQYKAFRLLSLKTSPECFGSTYEREIAFADDVWHGRLANPKATTLVALKNGQIVSTVTALGPLPGTPEQSSPWKNPWEIDGGEDGQAQLHFVLNGMFTTPSVRSQGIARALLDSIIKFGQNEAEKAGKKFACSIVVDEDNPAARGLYEKSGFVNLMQEAQSPESSRVAILMKYSPTF